MSALVVPYEVTYGVCVPAGDRWRCLYGWFHDVTVAEAYLEQARDDGWPGPKIVKRTTVTVDFQEEVEGDGDGGA